MRVGGMPPHLDATEVTGTIRAKSLSGSCTLTLEFGSQSEKISLSNKWEQYPLKFDFRRGEQGWLKLFASSDVLLDDIETFIHGDTNPTAFRGLFTNHMKEFKPGIIRTLQMGGGDIENFLQTKVKRHSFDHNSKANPGAMNPRKKGPFTPCDYYTMCEYLDCEVWLNLPGTVSNEGIKKRMEFLGAPANVGYGKLRAEQGHSEPFTETLNGIHIEFGNEIWNFAGACEPGYARGMGMKTRAIFEEALKDAQRYVGADRIFWRCPAPSKQRVST